MTEMSIYDFSVEALDGLPVSLGSYRDKFLVDALCVHLSAAQYHQLNALAEKYGDLNFTILGFPCNQFGLQSPEENHETLNSLRCVRPGGGFIPKFPIFGKVEVNGLNEDPLFTYLKDTLPFVNPLIGEMKKFYWSPLRVNDIRWNFEKFLIRADGVPYRRYELHSPFEELERDVADLL
ncbi:glutathione peroxidase 9 [Scleropages formosus]|uniref:glutathione peroxidase 9 n=1 Tax=Scleropages formosus TaxID=113540 RepID=UPI000878D45F|nr:glutathione peroxidase 1-like [Scleropages formosus]